MITLKAEILRPYNFIELYDVLFSKQKYIVSVCYFHVYIKDMIQYMIQFQN